MKSIHRIAVAAAVAAISLVAAAPAAADTYTGRIGMYSAIDVQCYPGINWAQGNRIFVPAPQMSSSPATRWDIFISTGTMGGGFHVQEVAYQAHLMKWSPTTRTWSWTGRSGALVRGRTGDALQKVSWSTWEGGDTLFLNVGSGHFSILMDYYWYADAHGGGGHVRGWAPMYESGRLGYCSY